GGVLFGISRMLPFLLDAISYALSFCGLLFLQLPQRKAEPDEDTGGLRGGFAWVLRQRVIRTTLGWIVLSNLIFSTLVIVILAAAGENHTGPAGIGVMM